MFSTLTRAVLAGAVVCATTLTAAGAAQAGEPQPGAPRPHLARSTTDAGPTPFTRRADTTATAPRTAAAADFTELPTECPAGQVFSTEYAYEDFGGGFPYDPTPAGTWGPTTYPSGNTVDVTAISRFDAGSPSDQTGFLQTTGDPVPSSGPLFVAFRYRGDSADGQRFVHVNDSMAELNPATDWTTVFLDVTAVENQIDPGVLYVGFEHTLAAAASTASTYEVDDVSVYTCVNAPNAGVRGDWTGEGRVDLLATHTDGDLYLYEGRGNGRVGSGIQVGSGWGGFTWQGSPGDVTGDRRTDLLGRAADGSMRLYAGRGAGSFASGRTVGVGWGSMTAFATPGDLTLDGHPELLARRSDGTLHLYTFSSTGAMRRIKQVGTGWNGMTWIIGMGDVNGDGRGDVVAQNVNGCLYAYNGTATGALSAGRKLGCGWGVMNWLTSPGDLDHDGYGDLIARNTDGLLYFYRGRPGGGVYAAVKIGSGWQGMASIL
ncbi:MAG TPA: VCBS repeat-containing protein [Angustibacter sp.]|nr:VCBS repeat-containing protein [Angustibacter sp.]